MKRQRKTCDGKRDFGMGWQDIVSDREWSQVTRDIYTYKYAGLDFVCTVDALIIVPTRLTRGYHKTQRRGRPDRLQFVVVAIVGEAATGTHAYFCERNNRKLEK